MPRYALEGPKPARVYEVILPKKLNYFGKLQEVLETLFSVEALREIPEVRETMAKRLGEAGFDPEAWLLSVHRACQGYTIYEADGRYVARSGGAIDERVLVIRFIFHDRPGVPDEDFRSTSRDIVTHLVSRRFAEELGVEEEVWFLEYGAPSLTIWRKAPDAPPGPGFEI